MPFDVRPLRPQRIAVIGGGISGLASAYRLGRDHDVTLFEAAPRLGGHARTVIAGKNGDQPVDTGFIVFNYANYPHLTRMFNDLDVPVVKSDMSFGASIDDGRIEYGLRDIRALMTQKRNLVRPGFVRMVRDILTFNKHAEALATHDDLTLGDLMDHLRLGDWFQSYYLLPLCGAIWSTPAAAIRDFPARPVVQFFRNHALLSTSGQHQWWTVDGGSREYVHRLEAHLVSNNVTIRPNTPVVEVARTGVTSTVTTKNAETGPVTSAFDHVVFACHPDQALRLLGRSTPKEQSILSDIRYQDNQVILHRDAALMPKRKGVWSSWVYTTDTSKPETSIGVTYWMNRLQNIPETDPMFVSLNPIKSVREDAIYDQVTFRHPVFDGPALDAQRRLMDIQGQNNTWFAGAYTRHGFHEDGFASAMRIARLMETQTA